MKTLMLVLFCLTAWPVFSTPVDSCPSGENPAAILVADNFCTGHSCWTNTCDGTNERPVCCPSGRRYLNNCDCKCYESPVEIQCDKQFTQCK